MGLFDKFKEKQEEVVKQDLSKEETYGGPFIMHLLMKEKCQMPSKERMLEVMEKYFGDVDHFGDGEKINGFAIKKYQIPFKDAVMPPQLAIFECLSIDDFKIDTITRSQMWDCENSEEILEECKYHIVATDMMASAMENYMDRADLCMDFMEALVELFPECEAVLFQSSGKLFARDKIVGHQIPREDRFIYFAVNVRFFNIQGSEEHIVDSIGMSILFLPDVQYHFHDMDPNWVVNHAYNILSYIYGNNAPIKSGETIDGITEGRIDQNIQWKCQYENALIQPARELLDICMGEYAAGNR